MESVKNGTKFIVIQDYPTHALTSWGKPCTGSEECIIPKETIMVAQSDQIKGALGFGVVPERYKELEKELIPEQTLNDKDYGGYYFVFESEDYGRFFIYLDESKNVPSEYAKGEKVPTLYSLNIAGQKRLKNPSPEDIQREIGLLGIENKSENFIAKWLMLYKGSESQIMVHLREDGLFLLDYQEGPRQYRSQKYFNLEEIRMILISYRNGTPEWKEKLEPFLSMRKRP